MAVLYCSCEQQHQIWGEFWWVGGKYGGKYEWVFFDGDQISETYADKLTHCPSCTMRLERMELKLS